MQGDAGVGGVDERRAAPTASGTERRGLVGEPRAAVPTGSRMIVVLSTPSVAQKLAKVRYATEAQVSAWWVSAIALQ